MRVAASLRPAVGLPDADPFAVDPPPLPAVTAAPLSPNCIRALNWLSLADCAARRLLRCHYPIVARLDDGDPHLFRKAAAAELQRRKPGLMVQLD